MNKNINIRLIISKASKWCIGEVIVVFLFILLINNFIGNSDNTITSDGILYYNYLPSIFLYHDFGKQEKVSDENILLKKENASLIKYKDHYLNKYSVGTSLLISPFFFYANATAKSQGYEQDGCSLPYQKAVFYAAVFYLFLTLIFIRLLGGFYNISYENIFITQLLIVFSTSVIHYTATEPSFSHIYSFFTITSFLFFTKKYFTEQRFNNFIYACVFLGLTILIRQINVLIILFIPFIAGSVIQLKTGIKNILSTPKYLAIGILSILLILSIQMIAWYIQTDEIIIYSYKGEHFNFLDPAFFKILFGYEKGLFVYAPALLFSFFGILFWIKDKNYFLLISWILFFSILTYILSSWWCWTYGCSFGLRAYIDYYGIFCIPIAILFQRINIYIKLLLLIILSFTAYLNIIQTYQYKNYFLHWDQMNKEKYWKVFLRTEARFRGILWEKKYSLNSSDIIKSDSINEVNAPTNSVKTVYVLNTKISSNSFDSLKDIEIDFYNRFEDNEDAKIELSILKLRDSSVVYLSSNPLIHCAEGELNTYQKGKFNYNLKALEIHEPSLIKLNLITANTSVKLKNFFITFYK